MNEKYQFNTDNIYIYIWGIKKSKKSVKKPTNERKVPI